MLVEMHKNYSYKLYVTDRTRHLDDMIEIARQIWNHFLALQKRYYQIYGKYISANRMKTHLTKLKRLPVYKDWNQLGSQAAQDVVERLDRSYQAFFDWCKKRSGPRKSPPKFRKRWKYRSFTLKQAGWAIQDNVITIARKYRFKFWKHRDFKGEIKTITIKRLPSGDYYIYLSVIEQVFVPDAHAGNAVGIDFGLKTFLTLSDGTEVASPEWLKNSLSDIRKASRNLSRKELGSNNRKRARLQYEKIHENVANRRRDWFYKLARDLTIMYSVICIEDLNLDGMKRIWGRKVSDLAYSEFVKILEYEALVNGCEIIKVDRWYPSSKTCSSCGFLNNDLSLKTRDWVCPSCGVQHRRDFNASVNILNQGLSTRYGTSIA